MIEQSSPLTFKDQEARTLALEQYKLLVESINKSNDVRELSNNYWITVNALGVSAAAYIKDVQSLAHSHKPLLLWFIISLGIALCLSWLNFLITIKNNIETRNTLLIEIERYFPFKVFTKSIAISGRQQGKGSLTIKEMVLPCLFLISYLALGYFLLFYQSEVVNG
jgi:hypothetical protein